MQFEVFEGALEELFSDLRDVAPAEHCLWLQKSGEEQSYLQEGTNS